MITAEPLALPWRGSKMVSAGMSLQVAPLASGAGPGHRRTVLIPRKALSVPGVAQFGACVEAAAEKKTPKKTTKNFLMKTSNQFREDYRTASRFLVRRVLSAVH